MKAIINNGTISIYKDEELVIADKIPTGCYDVCFSKEKGAFLSKTSNSMEVGKIYGSFGKKVDKALSAFNQSNRNIGVILSGYKGMGKTLFVKMLAKKSMEIGLPILIVNENFSGIIPFLNSIEQECVVIFDEFEKNFKDINDTERDNYESDQTAFLPLFDGLSDSKKFFLITCNDAFNLNPFLINRPGRFHYHFKLHNPERAEIKEYLLDNLNDKNEEIINKIISVANTSNMTYDCLRAICYELNRGYGLEETLEDLNIVINIKQSFEIKLQLNGSSYIRHNQLVLSDMIKTNLFISNSFDKNEDNPSEILISFNANDVIYENGKRIVKGKNIVLLSDIKCNSISDLVLVEDRDNNNY